MKLFYIYQRNERVVYLNLSKNYFSEDGAVHIGRAIGKHVFTIFLAFLMNMMLFVSDIQD